MRIKFLRGPKVGQVMDVVPHASFKVSEGLGDIEILTEAKVAQREPGIADWSIGFNGREFFLHVGCSSCGNKLVFFKPTEKAFLSHCGKVEKVPADVLQEYRDKSEGTEEQIKTRKPGAVPFV